MNDAIAVLYQGGPVPPVGGVFKPMKLGGYRDSGADIAFALRSRGRRVITPNKHPDPTNDADWSYPDSAEGIAAAIRSGATVLWANTVLWDKHPLRAAFDAGVGVIGQPPDLVERFDDKAEANGLLARHGLPAPRSALVGHGRPDVIPPEQFTSEMVGGFPAVVKPIRGRGSQGVSRVGSIPELLSAVQQLTTARANYDGVEYPSYGTAAIVEEYLPGEECTVAVLPPGEYRVGGIERRFAGYWSLPAVVRKGHVSGIVPYSGVEAVSQNSAVAVGIFERLAEACVTAAELVGPRAAVRIDCRQDAGGQWRLFDLNLKPNLTGQGRPGREDANGLVALAARAIGWDYPLLIENLAKQRWFAGEQRSAEPSGAADDRRRR